MQQLVFNKASNSKDSSEIPESDGLLPSHSPSTPSVHSSQSEPALQETLANVFKISKTEIGYTSTESEQSDSTQESFVQIITGPDHVKRIHLHLDQIKIEKGHIPTLLVELVSQLNTYTNFFSLANTRKYVDALNEMLQAISQNEYSKIGVETVKTLQQLNELLNPKDQSVRDGAALKSPSTYKQKLTKEMESIMDEYIVAELKKVIDEASAFTSKDQSEPEFGWVATKVFNGRLESYASDEELSNYGLVQPSKISKKTADKFRPYLPPNVKQAPDWLSLSKGQLMLAKDGNIYADLKDSYWELAEHDVDESPDEEERENKMEMLYIIKPAERVTAASAAGIGSAARTSITDGTGSAAGMDDVDGTDSAEGEHSTDQIDGTWGSRRTDGTHSTTMTRQNIVEAQSTEKLDSIEVTQYTQGGQHTGGTQNVVSVQSGSRSLNQLQQENHESQDTAKETAGNRYIASEGTSHNPDDNDLRTSSNTGRDEL